MKLYGAERRKFGRKGLKIKRFRQTMAQRTGEERDPEDAKGTVWLRDSHFTNEDFVLKVDQIWKSDLVSQE